MKVKIDGKYKTRGGRKIRRVLATDCFGDYPVAIENMDGSISRYALDGSFCLDSPCDKDLVEVSPYEDFKIDAPVMVSFTRHDHWYRMHFAGVSDDGRPMTFAGGRTSWTNEFNEKLEWEECRKPTEAELK